MATSAGSSITMGGNTLACNLVVSETGFRDVENTNSSHTAVNYDVVIPMNMVDVDCPWDPANTPESVGFVPGNKVNCVVLDGTTGKTITVTGALVSPHRRTRDVANDIIRSKFQLKGGTHVQA